MEYIAYTLIAIALLLHGYDSVKDRVSREIRHMVTLRQYTTLLFLAGTVTYGFIDGHGLILLTFIVLTALSSVMFGMNMAIYVEENEQGISKNLEKRKQNKS